MSARGRKGRILAWVLAIVALAFVAWVVPVRDRCWDPRAPESTKTSVTRELDGCVLHLRTGEVRIPAADCASLRCEPGLASTLSHARPGVLAALLALYAFGLLLWAARWRTLLAFAGVDMSVLQVWRVSTEAQAGGILLPGGIGGDALRIASVVARPTRAGERRAPAAIVVASVLLDRVIGLSVIAIVAAGMGFAWGGLRDATLGFVLAAIPVAALLGLVVLRRAPVHRVRWLVEGRLGKLVSPMLEYVRDPRAPGAIARAAALSLFVAAIQFAVIRGLVFALGAEPTAEKWVYVGSAMVFIVAAIPALPGGWGTADAAWVFFLGLAGLPPGSALAVGLLFRLFWYLSGIVGAALYVSRPRAPAVSESPEPADPPPA
ncbi:MAG TPA: lysylphosphatidylglycerol synthase transmembrane domain-containing protein [Polyangiaceae bacterium]